MVDAFTRGKGERWHGHRSLERFRTPCGARGTRGATHDAHALRQGEPASLRSASTALGRFAAPARGVRRTEDRRRRRRAGRAERAPTRCSNAGYNAELHEASDRIGGRCWTLRDAFAEGQIAEHGGELIDQGHTAIRQLASRARAQARQPAPGRAERHRLLGYFDGSPTASRRSPTTSRPPGRRSTPTSPPRAIRRRSSISTERGRQLDNDVDRRLDRRDVRGRDRRPGSGSCSTSPTTSSTAPSAREQSSLNLLYLLGYRGQGQFRVFGESNEKYHVVGGNDLISDRLAAKLAGQITDGLGARRGRRNSSGTFTLTFAQASGTKTVTADKVVLALPFSILRLVGRHLEGRLRAAEADRDPRAGHGHELEAARPVLEPLLARRWVERRDLRRHRLPEHLGGLARPARQERDPRQLHRREDRGELRLRHARVAREASSSVRSSRSLPGATKAWNGKAAIDFWTGYRWTKGSYSYWKVGQYQRFAGMEGRRQGNCLFAGEHTSIDFQGYLNGGATQRARSAP